jgi:acyl-coenzyme A thioesterase PaaI-like protein
MTDSFFIKIGDDAYEATPLGHGPWSETQEHGGPVSALLTRAMEEIAPAGGHLTRIAVDFLRPVPVGPVTVATQVIKPGRSAILLEATLICGDGPAMVARGWWRRRIPGLVRAVPLDWPAPPDVESLTDQEAEGDLARFLDRGYVASMQWRYAEGTPEEPGPTKVWARPRIPLVAGEADPSPTQLAMLLADCAAGSSAALDFRTHLFSNLDLVVNLLRPPRGSWISMHAVTSIDPDGGGLCVTRLGDQDGPIGAATQTLFVAPHAP